MIIVIVIEWTQGKQSLNNTNINTNAYDSLRMSDDPKSLLDQMKRALGDREDVFEDAEKERYTLNYIIILEIIIITKVNNCCKGYVI